MKNKIGIFILILALLFTGCRATRSVGKVEGTNIYCLDADYESLETETYILITTRIEDEIEELIYVIETGPEEADHKALLPENVTVQGFNFENGTATLDFSSGYREMSKTREVLVRAGIVRTLVQIQGVRYVAFTVDGIPIADSEGNEVGLMSADTFIENTGRQINNYQHTSISLYFAAEGGLSLVREARSIYYSSSKSLEWAIVERLIAGPKVKENYPVIPVGTQIISVTTSENVCYVNLTEGILTELPGISRRATLYSIVNSICENCNVSMVQMSVGGETDVDFGEGLDFSKPFEPDWAV